MIIKFIPDTITEQNFTDMYSSLPTESKEILSDAVLYSLSRQNIEREACIMITPYLSALMRLWGMREAVTKPQGHMWQ